MKHEVVGDGKYDNENVVQGAKVELIQRPDTNKVKNAADHVAADHIDTYPVNSSEPIHYVESNENGEYKLIGVVPGEYYVRFTYGDGSQKIVDPSSHDEIDNDVSIRKYKSTIITEEKAIEEIKNNINNDEGINNTDVNWYRNIGKNYSIAHDDLTIRQTFNESASGNVMKAYTPFMNIKIENDDKEKHDVKSTSDSKNIIEYINFGIINIPKIELGFEKNITNIKLVNGQLNTIVNGNPVNTASMKYVSNLSNRNLQHLTDGGDRIKIEIADNEIYGTKLEITYTLTVINNSEINYSDADGSYYLFGDKEGATEESITIEEVRDYLDKKLIFENGGDKFFI